MAKKHRKARDRAQRGRSAGSEEFDEDFDDYYAAELLARLSDDDADEYGSLEDRTIDGDRRGSNGKQRSRRRFDAAAWRTDISERAERRRRMRAYDEGKGIFHSSRPYYGADEGRADAG